MNKILFLFVFGTLCALIMSHSLVRVKRKHSKRQIFPPKGEAGLDYPTYSAVPPRLAFSCKNQIPGYFADPETNCQVWHWCLPNGQKFSFLCPNGTVFDQKYRTCNWWYNVNDCGQSAKFYSINEDLYKDKNGNAI